MRKQFKGALWVIVGWLLLMWSCSSDNGDFAPPQDADIVILGNTFAERMQHYAFFETILQKTFPADRLHIRNQGWSADEPGLSPRPLNFNQLDSLSLPQQADIVFACYGMNESFKGMDSLRVFIQQLKSHLTQLKNDWKKKKQSPEIVLVSPIAHEAQAAHLPDPTKHNQQLQAYTLAMQNLAQEMGLRWIDLFTPTQTLFQTNANTKYTINGIHLNEIGYREVSKMMAKSLGISNEQWTNTAFQETEPLRQLILEKNNQYFHRWRAVNGEYIYGRRKDPFGVHNFPSEMMKLDGLIARLEEAIFKAAAPEPVYTSPTQIVGTPDVPYAMAMAHDGAPTQTFQPDVSTSSFTLPPGYKIELVASEQDFPLENPVSMTFDAKGRLWVITMPTYPHYLPGYPPNDKIIILEDTNQDGKMDKHTVFADGLYLPTGFELGDGGVYVAQQPNLLFLKDTDGDDRADSSEIVLHGFGTEDSHHSISAFTWGPGGGLYMHEGTFHHTQVETPYGPMRNKYAGTFRYDPRNEQTETFVSYYYANPWGHVFDKWGQNYIADASGGANYFGAALISAIDYPEKRRGLKVFTSIVRPTAGCEIVSSRHFPKEAQGHFLINNNIGFQGTKQHRIFDEGAGVGSEEMENLLQSTDPNFRPVDIQFGPDGALYIVDWYNPLIGHMQFSVRDPGRDHNHGRIWRITYPKNPLLKPVDLSALNVPQLLEELKVYEDRHRYRARRELRDRSETEVKQALDKWSASLEKKDEVVQLEALWMYQQIDVVNDVLLRQLLQAKDARIRAAATRVLRFWRNRLEQPVALLKNQVQDSSPRVRLEAVTALSFFRTVEATELLLSTLDQPMDYYLDYALQESIVHLKKVWHGQMKKDSNWLVRQPTALSYLFERLNASELMALSPSKSVLEQRMSKAGVSRPDRLDAMQQLAKQEGVHWMTLLEKTLIPIEEESPLLKATRERKNGWDERVLAAGAPAVVDEWIALLLDMKPEALARQSKSLLAIQEQANVPLIRQAAMAALMMAQSKKGESAADAWQLASKSATNMLDFLQAFPLLPDPKISEPYYQQVKSTMTELPPSIQTAQAKKKNVKGRYLNVRSLKGRSRMTEIEVYNGAINLARLALATQSSSEKGSNPQRGIDGNRNSEARAMTSDRAAWFEVDLGAERTINQIVVHNNAAWRADVDRLQAFEIQILDANRKVVWKARHQKSPADQTIRFRPCEQLTDAIHATATKMLTTISAYKEDQLFTLQKVVDQKRYQREAMEALTRIPQKDWKAVVASKLVGPLSKQLASFDQGQKKSTLFDLQKQLADSLVGLLSEQEASQLDFVMRTGDVARIEVKTVPGEMKYDVTSIELLAGQRVELVFRNTDQMQHNLVVIKPGSLERVGELAEALAKGRDGIAKQYLPDSPDILYASRLLNPGEHYTFNFVAPEKPGRYPFVCTYPGHWSLMNGEIVVKAN